MTTTRNETAVLATTRHVLAQVVGAPVYDCDPALSLRDVPGLRYDSITVLECVGVLEAHFGVAIDIVDDDLVFSFRTLERIVQLIERKLADQATLSA